METIILPFLLAAVLVAAAVADVSVMQHRTQANCHTYTDAAKPASETRPRCPSGRGHAHGHSRGHSHGHTHSPGHHHGHALPPGHQYGQPTGTAVIIAEFFRELRQHKDYVVSVTCLRERQKYNLYKLFSAAALVVTGGLFV